MGRAEWTEVAGAAQLDRSWADCRGHFLEELAPWVQRGPWEPCELTRLRDAAERHGGREVGVGGAWWVGRDREGRGKRGQEWVGGRQLEVCWGGEAG